jgi:hypothetical protein
VVPVKQEKNDSDEYISEDEFNTAGYLKNPPTTIKKEDTSSK